MTVHQAFIVTVVFVFSAAVRVQYPSATESQINSKIGAFLAQSGDRDGGRERKSTEARTSFNRLSPGRPGE